MSEAKIEAEPALSVKKSEAEIEANDETVDVKTL